MAGVSGAGKSTALNLLEDQGYFCIKNLPYFLCEQTVLHLKQNKQYYAKVAISLSSYSFLTENTRMINQLQKTHDLVLESWFVTADPEVLLMRYDETKKCHPFSTWIKRSPQAINAELEALVKYAQLADYTIDTTMLSVQQLRQLLLNRLKQNTPTDAQPQYTEIHLFSFGFKHGMPKKADYIFDVRSLPNPYWNKALRPYSGQDQPVIDYLLNQSAVQEMVVDIAALLNKWCVTHQQQARSYIEIGIGCTGGQHRSVFIVEQLKQKLSDVFPEITLTHRELEK